MSAAEGREGPPCGAALVSFGTRGIRCQRLKAQTGRGSTCGLRSLRQDNAPLAQRLRPTPQAPLQQPTPAALRPAHLVLAKHSFILAQSYVSAAARPNHLAQVDPQRQATLAQTEVRSTFSQSGPRRPAAAGPLARTLGLRTTAMWKSSRKCACRRELNSHEAAKPQVRFGAAR